jgi:FkbM family methyltransferase
VANVNGFLTFVSATRPGRPCGGTSVTVSVRNLGGTVVKLRPGTTDGNVALATFVSMVHLPPAAINEPGLIWDLGANVGLTMAHMAHVFPRARIIGVEMDHANADLARANVLRWSDRCEVLEAAVWPRDEAIGYARLPGHGDDGLKVTGQGGTPVKTLTLKALLELGGPPDYVKMDIEGAEMQVLRENTDWARSVRSIGVECHPPYALMDARRDLERLGFRVEVFPQSFRRRARSAAFGIRDDAQRRG